MTTAHQVCPAGTRSPCPHHVGMCAYLGTEPGRCPRCHRSWSLIEGCGCEGCGGRAAHEAWHDRRERRAAAKKARKAVIRLQKQGPGPGAYTDTG